MQSNKTCPLVEQYLGYLVVIKGRSENTVKEYCRRIGDSKTSQKNTEILKSRRISQASNSMREVSTRS